MTETPAAFTEQDHFTEQDYALRMDRAAREAAVVGLAGLLATPGPDLMWLCGYRPAAATEHLTLLVLTADSEPRLLVPASERPDAEGAPGAVRISAWKDGQDPYAAAAGLLRPHGRYGVSDSTWALHLLGLQEVLPLTTYRPLSTALPMLRVVKDEHEVARLAAAGAAADAAYDDVLSLRFAGRRETDVAADLGRLLREHGHGRVDFTVVGSGPDGADPHHRTGRRTLTAGDMVVLDFGGHRDGYGSGITRTVHVGEPTAEERRVHEVVQDAQQAAFEAVRPDVPCQDVDRVARTVITDAGYGGRGVPRTGHGIGVTAHEAPHLAEGEEQPLLPGMCFSLVAGIHLPGRFGIRLGDVVTCTETGGRRLNTASRELAVVK
ncbi:peptidase [Streptomyces lincolnensis]|uniref:Peptidase n=1 Tax=Streptomyces lincolnensis TaxID=1915 RepID=A0A1B1MDD6_STRLN|nr:M24 family metallopeptidase [Streptomyces lincolnensis]ANS66630.1 peptidase [Streptomyces lincolnensis]AXG55500.1 peptidase [Streptomyces lincolnensis]QMV07999.1 M24 family metallopeptidase [Streptomyces lincolnensis]